MAISESSTAATAQAESVTIKFDGSYLPEENEHGPSAAVGYTITDSGGNVIAEDGYALQCFISNTHTEFQAVIDALEAARDIPGVQRVFLRGDSESVIDAVCPRTDHQPSEDIMQNYAQRAKELVEEFDYVHVKKINRDMNERADDLAYRGHDIQPWDN